MRLLRAWPALVFLAAAASAAPASLESLARAHRQKPTPASRASLLRFAAAHPKDARGALALVVAGVVKLEQGDAAQAVRDLKAAAPRLPLVADHVAVPLASALYQAKDFDAALAALEPVWKAAPASPAAGSAAMVAARAYLEKKQPADAVRVLEANAAGLFQPQGLALLARAQEARGEAAAAAAAFQRVFLEYPASQESSEAALALERLRGTLGAQYPSETGTALLERAEKLVAARDYRRARQELEALAGRLTGAERDLARVRLGAVDYTRGETAAAYRYLRGLEVPTPEADAERLFYLLSCARRLDGAEAMGGFQAELARKHPKSPWRAEALVAEGNRHLLDNRAASYGPVFRACYESFPDHARAPYCHWKVTWSEYLSRGAGAAALLREHLERYPASEKTSAALYFLGRLSEDARDAAAAGKYFGEIPARFPNSYYAMLAREKVKKAPPGRTGASPSRPRPSFEPAPAARRRIERARLLASAALDDWAAGELRFEARNGGQSYLMALELARLASRRGAHDQSVRAIIGLAAGYLFLPQEAAPAEFWKLAFPFPYRAQIEKYSRERSLDPLLVTALIRQESLFDPKAVSRARAHGLMQVLPSTGRQLARKAGLRGFTASSLFRPEINVNLGTRMLRSLVDQYGGRLEPALAAYNGGKTRADAWLNWGEFREPAEFVETIPFTETRDYVQIVLRNADLYRRLYDPKPARP